MSNRLCFAVYYALDELLFDVIMRMRFPEASKNVIHSPWTLDNWTSQYALWLDDFGLSDYAPITLYKKEVQKKDSESYIYGTSKDQDGSCTPGVFKTFLSQTGYSALDDWYQAKVDSIIEYMLTNYESTISSGQLLDL